MAPAIVPLRTRGTGSQIRALRQWDGVSSRPDDSAGGTGRERMCLRLAHPPGVEGVRTRWLSVSIRRPCKGRTIIALGFIHGFRTPGSACFARGSFLLRGVVDRAQQETASGRAEGAADRHPWMNPWARIVTPFRARACDWTRLFAPRGGARRVRVALLNPYRRRFGILSTT